VHLEYLARELARLEDVTVHCWGDPRVVAHRAWDALVGSEPHLAAPQAMLARHGVDPSRPSVVFVGRITRQKGVPYLLDAALEFDSPAQLVLCAGAPDTPEIGAEVEQRVERLEEERGNVVWIDQMLPKADVIQLLSHATVFVCPSIYEPLGIVNLEAMACEAAVVATATGGIVEASRTGSRACSCRSSPRRERSSHAIRRRSRTGSPSASTRCWPIPSAAEMGRADRARRRRVRRGGDRRADVGAVPVAGVTVRRPGRTVRGAAPAAANSRRCERQSARMTSAGGDGRLRSCRSPPPPPPVPIPTVRAR
jgi:hypothetical protein